MKQDASPAVRLLDSLFQRLDYHHYYALCCLERSYRTDKDDPISAIGHAVEGAQRAERGGKLYRACISRADQVAKPHETIHLDHSYVIDADKIDRLKQANPDGGFALRMLRKAEAKFVGVSL